MKNFGGIKMDNLIKKDRLQELREEIRTEYERYSADDLEKIPGIRRLSDEENHRLIRKSGLTDRAKALSAKLAIEEAKGEEFRLWQSTIEQLKTAAQKLGKSPEALADEAVKQYLKHI